MTQGEVRTIRNLIERLKKPDCGCANHYIGESLQKAAQIMHEKNVELVARIYLNSWIIPALKYLLPESRNVELAESLSR